jgi:uncharacterized protein
MTDVLAIFAKSPRPGTVKTRMTPPLTPPQAARVYEASLLDVVDRARRARADVRLFHDPHPESAEYFRTTFPGLPLRPQQGDDLGERLITAVGLLFSEGAERVAIIGADSPTLPLHFLDHAFRRLDHREVVLGPTTDGGYYLVGIRKAAWPAASALFEEVEWSTDAVFGQTLDHASRAALSVATLEEWYDIDGFDDLALAWNDVEAESALARTLAGQKWADDEVVREFRRRVSEPGAAGPPSEPIPGRK